jgi:hypothetical protein
MTEQTIEIFFSYAHEDEALRDELAKHLKLLERQGIIKAWHDRNITAGEEWKTAINTHPPKTGIFGRSMRSQTADSLKRPSASPDPTADIC